jgi:hypothetical protein
MRLPGTRYQEHGWEQVRKLLGLCSLAAFADCDAPRLLEPRAACGAAPSMSMRCRSACARCGRSRAREAPGNSYGESVLELALGLLFELQARPGDWEAFAAPRSPASMRASARSGWRPAAKALLRKKVNDMYAVLRDKVDADNYQAACGRDCSPTRCTPIACSTPPMATSRGCSPHGRSTAPRSAPSSDRHVDEPAAPIEVRQMKSIGGCRPEWIIRWSETLERFTGAPGPLHTRSKRFASLKNNPDKIAAMLREIGDYEELSANRDRDWLGEAGEAAAWLGTTGAWLARRRWSAGARRIAS